MPTPQCLKWIMERWYVGKLIGWNKLPIFLAIGSSWVEGPGRVFCTMDSGPGVPLALWQCLLVGKTMDTNDHVLLGKMELFDSGSLRKMPRDSACMYGVDPPSLSVQGVWQVLCAVNRMGSSLPTYVQSNETGFLTSLNMCPLTRFHFTWSRSNLIIFSSKSWLLFIKPK